MVNIPVSDDDECFCKYWYFKDSFCLSTPLLVLQFLSISPYPPLKIDKFLELICNAKKVDCDEAKALWGEKFTYFMFLHKGFCNGVPS